MKVNIMIITQLWCILELGYAYVRMSLVNECGFLKDRSEDVYLRGIISKAVTGCMNCLADNKPLIEVEFLPTRKSDISVTDTLQRNRIFVREFINSWSSLKKNLWIVFPDNKEANLAKQDPNWGSKDQFPHTISSIDSLLTINDYELTPDVQPSLIIAVNPGFNVEEWIKLAKVPIQVPTIVVNGNLDRLRNGYYPSLFYPELSRVSKSYYSQATQALFLSPIAVQGRRYAAWLTKWYPNENWEVIMPQQDTENCNIYDVIYSSKDTTLDNNKIWKLTKQEYINRNGGSWF